MILNVKTSMFYPKRRKIQTYSEELGFTECPSDVTKPQCIVCYKTLSSEGMKPAKLKQNLMTQYREVTGKFQTFLKQKEYLKQKKAFTKSLVSIEKLMNASYFVALRVARAKNVHTIVEYWILPTAIDIKCEAVLDGEYAAKLTESPLSNNTISRIDDISNDIKAHFAERLKQTFFQSNWMNVWTLPAKHNFWSMCDIVEVEKW